MPEFLPQEFHTDHGLKAYLTWAEGKPFIQTKESELQSPLTLGDIALAYGLALRDMLKVVNLEPGSTALAGVPGYFESSPCGIEAVDKLSAACSEMTTSLNSVYGDGEPRRQKRKGKESM